MHGYHSESCTTWALVLLFCQYHFPASLNAGCLSGLGYERKNSCTRYQIAFCSVSHHRQQLGRCAEGLDLRTGWKHDIMLPPEDTLNLWHHGSKIIQLKTKLKREREKKTCPVQYQIPAGFLAYEQSFCTLIYFCLFHRCLLPSRSQSC